MKGVAVFLCLVASGAPALAFDVAALPDTCKATLDTLKGDKPRFAQYGGAMTRARKGNNTAEFCAAAKGTLALIVNESDQVDHCLGDLAVDKAATPAVGLDLARDPHPAPRGPDLTAMVPGARAQPVHMAPAPARGRSGAACP